MVAMSAMSTSLTCFLLLKGEADYILFLKMLSLICNSKMLKMFLVKPNTSDQKKCSTSTCNACGLCHENFAKKTLENKIKS